MEHIKINELSAGDWVMYELHPYIVQQIDGECDHVVISGLEGVREKHIDYLEPIRIKPEHLERNGFMKRGFNSNNRISYHKDRALLYPMKGGRRWMAWIFEEEDMCVIKATANVGYVHQLQHVQRLAGIEKEIEL